MSRMWAAVCPRSQRQRMRQIGRGVTAVDCRVIVSMDRPVAVDREMQRIARTRGVVRPALAYSKLETT